MDAGSSEIRFSAGDLARFKFNDRYHICLVLAADMKPLINNRIVPHILVKWFEPRYGGIELEVGQLALVKIS